MQLKKLNLIVVLLLSSFYSIAQSGYNISIHLKNSKDTLAYLTYYQFDKTFIKDTCTQIKNGKIIFKGKEKLDKGIYSLVNQNKNLLFDFFIDDNTQNLELKSEDGPNLIKELTAVNSESENQFFEYLRYVSEKNIGFQQLLKNAPPKTKKDTLAFIEKQSEIDKNIKEIEDKFIQSHKGTFIGDVINLKTEKTLNDPENKFDNLAKYNFYKNNYWSGVDFKDDATLRNPFFSNKLNKYFENVIETHPDSTCVEIDRMLNKTTQGSLIYKLLLSHFTYTYESSKLMGFEKVFVHLSDKYFKTGKANGIYESDDVVNSIIKKADKLKPLLIGAKAPDLWMIKASDFGKMKGMGFEDANNSDEITKVFYDHQQEVNKMFVKLSDVKAEYTLLLFWDVDCGHCQKEVPKILEVYNELIKEKKDVKVYSVYTLHEGQKYQKYISDHKLPWINVYDGAFYNNIAEKYDVVTTPILYILDKNKVIRAKKIGADQIKFFIDLLENEAADKI